METLFDRLQKLLSKTLRLECLEKHLNTILEEQRLHHYSIKNFKMMCCFLKIISKFLIISLKSLKLTLLYQRCSFTMDIIPSLVLTQPNLNHHSGLLLNVPSSTKYFLTTSALLATHRHHL